MTKLTQIGEFGLIERFSRKFAQNLPLGVQGMGDDCAIIPQNEKTSLLVTTDALVENVHFLRTAISPENLGHKALAVNLSDIAAMGGTPAHIFLTLAIPEGIEVEWLDRFFDGFYELARKEKITLLGGDTTRSPALLFINVTLLGTVRTELVKLRSTAETGDKIFVTGCLGDSAAGLKALMEKRGLDEDIQKLIENHHRPLPHLIEGNWLAQHSAVHAMMDVSDGIDSDIKRILEQSKKGARIDLENLPRSSSLRKASTQFQWNDLEIAATGGEDYCLLLTVASDSASELAQSFSDHFQRPLFCIGEITESIGELAYEFQGKRVEFLTQGYDHFKIGPS